MVKKNYKIIIGIVIGIIVSSLGVYAVSLSSSEVTYDNNNSGIKSKTLQGAIDELYSKAKNNDKIVAYEYDETENHKCINGEESTCVKTTCYTNEQANSCKQGTIIRYYVNDYEYHYFYVLHDDGATITMQQRENTVRNIPWNAGSNDNTKGPVTILPMLEAATSMWTNVNILDYAPGETNLYENKFTGCTRTESVDSDYTIRCELNTYDSTTLGPRKARARMITAQEAGSTGCLVWKDGSKDDRRLENSVDTYNRGSCPDWMHNYLYQSTKYGGSYNDATTNENGVSNNAYWTTSANSSTITRAWCVDTSGLLSGDETSNVYYGARAVVVISK